MEIKAKLIKKLPVLMGKSKNGEWKKQDIIVETIEQYSKTICISVWGEKIDDKLLKEGEILDISINLESKEYNEKWYTDVKAWRIQSSNDDISNIQENNMPDIKPSDDDLDWLIDGDGEGDHPF